MFFRHTILWLEFSVSIVLAGNSSFLDKVLIPGEDWRLLGKGYRFSEGTAVDRNGRIYFNDLQTSKGYRIDGDKVVEWRSDTRKSIGQTFGTDGESLYTVSFGYPEVTCLDVTGNSSIFAKGSRGNDIVCHPNGNFYITNPPGVMAENPKPSKIWLLTPNADWIQVHEGIRFTNGIAISPDGKSLYVNDWRGVHVYRFDILENGRLGEAESFIQLKKPDDRNTAGSDGMRVDSEGRVWVTTLIGIQVFDEKGKPLGILKGPEERQSHFVFGGTEFDTMYLTTVNAIYRRKLNVRGINPWDRNISNN